jgi:hypothetical protein
MLNFVKITANHSTYFMNPSFHQDRLPIFMLDFHQHNLGGYMSSEKLYCSVDFCTHERHTYPKNTAYCKNHELIYRHTGSPTGTEFLDFCTVDSCQLTHDRYGFCSQHYARFKRTGSPLLKRKEPSSPDCSVDGCSRPKYTKGLCNTHYVRLRKTGDTGSADIQTLIVKPCSVPQCSKNGGLVGSFLCRRHRMTAKNYSLSEERYLEMMSSLCAICGRSDNLTIDHDHSCCPSRESCGECVRGTLCQDCNKMLGIAQDDSNLLMSAVRYLNV